MLSQPDLLLCAQLCDDVADALVNQGYFCQDHALPQALTAALLNNLQQLEEEEALQPAGIGRQQQHQLNRRIRRDKIHWLSTDDPVQATYLAWMQALQQGLNQRLFMGLFDYESHFAHYPPGAFYARHLDAFQGRSNRVLTSVYYLNQDWQEADGGELLLYTEEQSTALAEIRPEAGRLLIFLSDRFPHEVRPTQRDRYSIAGWFRINNSLNGQIDPPS